MIQDVAKIALLVPLHHLKPFGPQIGHLEENQRLLAMAQNSFKKQYGRFRDHDRTQEALGGRTSLLDQTSERLGRRRLRT